MNDTDAVSKSNVERKEYTLEVAHVCTSTWPYTHLCLHTPHTINYPVSKKSEQEINLHVQDIISRFFLVICEIIICLKQCHRAGEMALGTKVPATKPDDLSRSLRPTWWKEGSDSHQLSLDLQCVPWHMHAAPHTNKTKT